MCGNSRAAIFAHAAIDAQACCSCPTTTQHVELKRDGGGAAMNQAIHTVDLLIWLAQAAMPELATPEHDESNPVAEVSCCEPSVMRA